MESSRSSWTNKSQAIFSFAVYEDLKLRAHSGVLVVCAFLPDKEGLSSILSQILVELIRQLIAQRGLAVIYHQVLGLLCSLQSTRNIASLDGAYQTCALAEGVNPSSVLDHSYPWLA